MLNTLTRLLRDIGLTINVRKTKLMVTAKCGIPFVRPVDPVLLVDGAVVSVVQEFSYLGTMLNSRAGIGEQHGKRPIKVPFWPTMKPWWVGCLPTRGVCSRCSPLPERRYGRSMIV